jgi:hypothetical protein
VLFLKAATGELNLTVITLVAIGLIIAFFTAFLYPRIKDVIADMINNVNTSGDTQSHCPSGGC